MLIEMLTHYCKHKLNTKLFRFRATLYFIDQAIENLEKKPVESNQHREPSVLEKLLKIDKHVAIVMALDMLLAGVDTVRYG